MLIRRAPRFASNDITDEKHYLSRREWMIGAAALTLLPGESPAAPQGQPLTATRNEAQSLKEPPTKSGWAPVAGGACTGSRTSPGWRGPSTSSGSRRSDGTTSTGTWPHSPYCSGSGSGTSSPGSPGKFENGEPPLSPRRESGSRDGTGEVGFLLKFRRSLPRRRQSLGPDRQATA